MMNTLGPEGVSYSEMFVLKPIETYIVFKRWASFFGHYCTCYYCFCGVCYTEMFDIVSSIILRFYVAVNYAILEKESKHYEEIQ